MRMLPPVPAWRVLASPLLLCGALLTACSHAPIAPAEDGGVAVDAGPADAGRPSDRWLGQSLYFVITDRFANGDAASDAVPGWPITPNDPAGWHGGDFAGLQAALPDIASMGFSGVWITPVIEQHHAHGYHGYWGWDFEKVDPHLGDEASLASLADALHARGMRFMVDTVVNHTGPYGRSCPSFPNAADYHRLGTITDYGDPNQVENGDLAGLPDLAQENASVAERLERQTAWLLRVTKADGLRLDTAKHVPRWYLERWGRAAGTFVLPEVLDGDATTVAGYAQLLGSALDFPLHFALRDVFGTALDASKLGGVFSQDARYPDARLLGTFLDNHDVPRFLCHAAGAGTQKSERLHAALGLLFGVRGIPVVAWGTELGFDGCGDPENRADLFTRRDVTTPTAKLLARLHAVRAAHPALRTGTQRELVSRKEGYALLRTLGEDAVVVAVNPGDAEVALDLGGLTGARLTELLREDSASFTVTGNVARITVPPRGTRWLAVGP